tara:strand:- start:146 stop:658 length:513 start_codon:yes stop_codon:yes gene_type:complete
MLSLIVVLPAIVFVGILMSAFLKGMSEAKHISLQDGWDYETTADSDFFAGCAYEETGDPAAFYFFNDPEPVQSVAKPAPKPAPKRATVSPRIKSLEKQVKELKKMVKDLSSTPQVSKKSSPKVHPLQQDCVDALVAIGYNKTEAKNMVKNQLAASIGSVQDFLTIVMRKA